MSYDLDLIQNGPRELPPRIILCGTEKTGKTHFAAHAPNSVILPVKGETGADYYDGVLPTANTFDDVMGWIGSLAKGEHEYKTLCIDSVSALEPLIWDAVCTEAKVDSIEKVGGGYGKGYGEALAKWRRLEQGLDYLREHKGMTCILIAHVKVKHFEDPNGDGYDRYQIDLHEKAMNLLSRWADSTLFFNRKTFVQEKDAGFGKTTAKAKDQGRYMFTQSRPAHPGGGRGVYGQIPYEIELPDGDSYAVFKEAVETAKENNKKGDK